MKRACLALALALSLGCDSATVHEHIIDNFVCVYMPWWMGDCQGTEVVNQVTSVLDHGLVRAHLECSGVDLRPDPPNPCPESGFAISLDYLQDGSGFLQFQHSSQFVPRGNSFGPLSGSNSDSFVTFPGDGTMLVESISHVGSATCSGTYVKSIEIDGACTGFNLDAFGVEE